MYRLWQQCVLDTITGLFMHILTLDTTQLDARFAIYDMQAKKLIIEEKLDGSKQKAEKLIEILEPCLQDDQFDFSKIIAVVGPGVFTSIRVGLSLAKGLGLGFNIPVIGISVFESLYQEFLDKKYQANAETGVKICLPARQGGVYIQPFSKENCLPFFLSQEEFVEHLKSEDQNSCAQWITTDHEIGNIIYDEGAASYNITVIASLSLANLSSYGAHLNPTTHPCKALYIKEADAVVGKPILSFE